MISVILELQMVQVIPMISVIVAPKMIQFIAMILVILELQMIQVIPMGAGRVYQFPKISGNKQVIKKMLRFL